MNVIGTCSECGGPVELPSMMVDPVPCCKRCGATTAAPAHGPIIPMRPRKRIDTNTPSPYDLSWRGAGLSGRKRR